MTGIYDCFGYGSGYDVSFEERYKLIRKSEFVERFPELSVFFKACRALYDEMICIFPYFCPCEIIVREIREISF